VAGHRQLLLRLRRRPAGVPEHHAHRQRRRNHGLVHTFSSLTNVAHHTSASAVETCDGAISLDGTPPATQNRGKRMRCRTLLTLGLCLFVLGSRWASVVDAQRGGTFMGSSDDPAIRYSTAPLNNAVVDVNRKLEAGAARLTFEGRSGFLRSALEALQIPVDSQLLVFSRLSLQGRRVGEQNPRALFFNDRVALGWVRGGDVLEVAAHD